EHFPEAIGGPPVFTRTGLVLVATEAERDSLLSINQALQRDLGIDIRLLSGLELLELDPNAHLADNELAVLEKEAGLLEVVQVIASFAEAARLQGADICQGVEVKRILSARGKITSVETN